MKTAMFLLAIIAVMFLLGSTPGGELSKEMVTSMDGISSSLVLPDVMNNVNILERSASGSHSRAVNLDSFPLFSGYPQHISGQSIEGGIVCNMDADPELEIVYGIGFTVQAWNLNGTAVPGWPKTVSSYAVEGAPAFGDIDGDGQGEIVVTNHGTTSGGFIYAFKRDGSNATGFPVNHGYSSRTPVLADLNGDGAMEIIVNKRLYPVGEVWVYRGNGTAYPGWPKPIGHVPASSAAVGDITGDGIPEVIAESYTALYVWKANGDSLPGFPFFMPSSAVNSYSSPVLADLDRDGYREIVFGTHILGGGGIVFVLKRDGSQLPGWPLSTGNWIYGPPAIGYIDADTLLDIAVGDQVLSASPTDYLYAWNVNGVALQGFPVGPLNAINNQVALADLDYDNQMELMIDDNTTLGIYLAYKRNGTPLSGWPIILTGTTFFNMPCLTDVNRDGILDIVGAAREGSSSPFTNVYLWNTGIEYNRNKVTIPVWQYNNQHDGMYGRPAIVDVKEFAPTVISDLRLDQNFPNPFNPTTTITYSLSSQERAGTRSTHVQLNVYDLLGRKIATLVNEGQAPGSYEVTWDATGVGTGVYFYRLEFEGFSSTKKLLLMR